MYNDINRGADNPNLGFSIASVVLGILAIISCCTALLPIPFGALGLVFVALSHRGGRPLPTLSVVGLVLCIIGIVIGVCYTWYLVTYYIIPMYNDPDFYHNMIENYKTNYGLDLSQYFQNFN